MESKYLVSVFFGSIFNGFNGIQNKNKWTNQHKLTWIHLDRKCFDMLRYISIVLELFAYCNQSIFWDICNLYYSEVLYMLSNAFSIKEIKNEIKKYINSTFFFFFSRIYSWEFETATLSLICHLHSSTCNAFLHKIHRYIVFDGKCNYLLEALAV